MLHLQDACKCIKTRHGFVPCQRNISQILHYWVAVLGIDWYMGLEHAKNESFWNVLFLKFLFFNLFNFLEESELTTYK